MEPKFKVGDTVYSNRDSDTRTINKITDRYYLYWNSWGCDGIATHKFFEDTYFLKETIDDQTIHFWNLQLQFMEMEYRYLLRLLSNLKDSGLYRKNEFSESILQKVLKRSPTLRDHMCLATHLAAQMSGIEE